MRGALANPELAERARKRQQLEGEQMDSDFRFILSTAQGRRFVYSLCFGACRLTGPSFNASGSLTFFQEGQRAVGIQLWGEAQRVAPADVVLMLSECLSAQQEAALRQKTEEATETDE